MKQLKHGLISFGLLFGIIVVWLLIKEFINVKLEDFTSLCLGFFIYLYVIHSKHFD